MAWRSGLGPVLLVALLAGAVHAVELKLPYREEGLSRKEAAAFLLERFAYGPRPGEVEKVAKLGPATWLARQLAAEAAEPELDERLKAFPPLP